MRLTGSTTIFTNLLNQRGGVWGSAGGGGPHGLNSTDHTSPPLSIANGGTNATSFTAGSIIFAGSGGTSLTQDNASLFWDDTNNRLGIGTASPSTTLSVGNGVAENPIISVERPTSGGGAGARITLQSGGAISGGTNSAGGELRLSSGISTGSGASFISFYIIGQGASGTADRTPVQSMRLDTANFGARGPSLQINDGTLIAANSGMLIIRAPTGHTGVNLINGFFPDGVGRAYNFGISSGSISSFGIRDSADALRILLEARLTGGSSFELIGDMERPIVWGKSTVAVVAPGAAKGLLRWEAGTTAGTAKLVGYAGTSTTGTTIADNIGSGF